MIISKFHTGAVNSYENGITHNPQETMAHSEQPPNPQTVKRLVKYYMPTGHPHTSALTGYVDHSVYKLRISVELLE